MGMAKPTVGWALRRGGGFCGLWGGWWPALACGWCAVEGLGWTLRRVGECDGLVWGLVDVAPLVEEVVVGDGDEQRDQDGLGDAAVGEPVLGIAEVEVVSLEPAVEALGVGADGLVGPDPGGTVIRLMRKSAIQTSAMTSSAAVLSGHRTSASWR
ncbi:hypothetical protein AB0I81_16105 [Nonomuraea sp. NPDC050404]|uniref:hypothetical protein n=1 Tax=Nonomuraea sp. NPDC050404 TaxID=3155783 RepID=UPI0034031F07